jgi:hypothetical protein
MIDNDATNLIWILRAGTTSYIAASLHLDILVMNIYVGIASYGSSSGVANGQAVFLVSKADTEEIQGYFVLQ